MIHLLPEYVADAPEDERHLVLCGKLMDGKVLAAARLVWFFHAAHQDVCPECLDVASKEPEGIIPPTQIFYRMRERSGKSLCLHEHKTSKSARTCKTAKGRGALAVSVRAVPGKNSRMTEFVK